MKNYIHLYPSSLKQQKMRGLLTDKLNSGVHVVLGALGAVEPMVLVAAVVYQMMSVDANTTTDLAEIALGWLTGKVLIAVQ
jgi:hypothetical protein